MLNEKFIQLVSAAIDALEAQGQYSYDLYRCNYYKKGICCIVGQMMPKDVAVEADGESKTGGDSNIGSLYYMLEDNKKGALASWLRQFSINQIALLTKLQVFHDHGAILKGVMKESIEQMRTTLKSWSETYV